ncbi:MAG: hypothetical protein HGJ94_06440 [Desulfosarcina sp.]|nr:hypothetical protein [Desulfosarcina sp.]
MKILDKLFFSAENLEKIYRIEEEKNTKTLIKLTSRNTIAIGLGTYRIMMKIRKDLKYLRFDEIKRAAKYLNLSRKVLMGILINSEECELQRRINLGTINQYDLIQDKPILKYEEMDKKEYDELSSDIKGNSIVEEITGDMIGVYFPIDLKEFKRAARELDVNRRSLITMLRSHPNLIIDKADLERKSSESFVPHGGTNFPRKILVFYLHKNAGKKIKHKQIINFLHEQKILGENSRNESFISRCISVKNSISYENAYNFYRDIFWSVNSDRSPIESCLKRNEAMRTVAVDNPEGDKDLIFPDWHSFIK